MVTINGCGCANRSQHEIIPKNTGRYIDRFISDAFIRRRSPVYKVLILVRPHWDIELDFGTRQRLRTWSECQITSDSDVLPCQCALALAGLIFQNFNSTNPCASINEVLMREVGILVEPFLLCHGYLPVCNIMNSELESKNNDKITQYLVRSIDSGKIKFS